MHIPVDISWKVQKCFYLDYRYNFILTVILSWMWLGMLSEKKKVGYIILVYDMHLYILDWKIWEKNAYYTPIIRGGVSSWCNG